MKLYKLFTFLLFVLIAGSNLFSQCGNVAGHVYDLDSRDPIEFANMSIIELGVSTTTNEKGEYEFKNVCPGEYTFRITHVGCDVLEIKVVVKKNITHKDFDLPHNQNVLKEICINEDAPERKTTQTKNELNKNELHKNQGKQLGEILKEINGVNTIQTGASVSKPVIQGLHSNRIQLLNNGVKLESQQWGMEHAPEIDPFIAGKITVIKGANAVRYGSDAIAGIVLVEPEKMRDSVGFNGTVRLAGFSNNYQGVVSAQVDEKFKKIPALSWRLQGTFNKGGNTKTPGYYLKNTGNEEHHFSGTVQFKKEKLTSELFYSQFNSEFGIFEGSHIGNVTDLMNAINAQTPYVTSGFSYIIQAPKQKISHELCKFSSEYTLFETGKLNLVYSRQYNSREEYDIHQSAGNNNEAEQPEFKMEITTHALEFIFDNEIIGKKFTQSGIAASTQSNTYEGRFFIPYYKNYSAGAFAIHRIKLKKLDYEAGLRYDYKWLQSYYWDKNTLLNPIAHWSNLSFNAGIIYRYNSHFVINFNSGKAWRAPTVNELYSKGIHHGAATYEIGNSELKTEVSYNNVLTANFHDHKTFSGEITLYNNFMKNFIYARPQFPATVTIQGAFPTYIYSQTNANISGCDLSVGAKIFAGFSILANASIIRAIDKKTSAYLSMIPSNRYAANLSYDFKNTKNVSGISFTLKNNYIAKQIHIQPNSDYMPPPEAYYLMGASISASFKIKKQTLFAGIECNNLLNEKYREYLNRFRYFSDETGRNISIKTTLNF